MQGTVLVYLENVQHFPHSFHSCPHLWVFFSGGEQKARAALEECVIYPFCSGRLSAISGGEHMNSSAFWGSGIYGTPLVEIYAVLQPFIH